jgi:ubiquinone/menaquinone biosynthesis C-methylase UbiE
VALQDWRRLAGDFFSGRKGPFPHQLAWFLDLRVRRLILAPQQLANRLHLEPTSRVLEVGPGSGYFTAEVAERIPQGHLEVLDLQPEMLEKTKRKLDAAGLHNVGYGQGDACNLPFADGEFDVVFFVALLGEVPDRSACINSVHKVLRSGGLLSITEHQPDPDFTPLSAVRALTEASGFQFVESFGRSWAYTANFLRSA